MLLEHLFDPGNFWLLIFTVAVFFVVLFVVHRVNQKMFGPPPSEAANKKTTRKPSRKLKPSETKDLDEISVPSEAVSKERSIGVKPKSDLVITDETREQIGGMLEAFRPAALEPLPEKSAEEKAQQRAVLQESGVIDALAQTMVSEVKIDQSPDGKISQMTIEGGLIFDEDDLGEKE